MEKYQLIVIGGGAGGLTVAAGAASLGAKVALIEKNKALGGDCLHYGCVPSKALIEGAREIYTARKVAETYQLKLQGQVDVSLAMKRVHDAIDEIQAHDSHERFKRLGVDLYEGKGRFLDHHRLEIDGGQVIYGKRIVIATGSSPFIPPIPGLDQTDYVTNETIFNIRSLPAKMAVIGGGPIGLELAQSFARFGTDVTVIEAAPHFMPKEDEEVRGILKELLDEELRILFNTKVIKVEQKGDQKQITISQNGIEKKQIVDLILVATGRRPNIQSLQLERAGVQVENGHIKVKRTLQTTTPNIFAIGDVTGNYPFTHAANLEGKLIVGNAVFGLKRKINYDALPWVTYTDPEIFHLGMTEEEARKKFNGKINVYRITLSEVDRFIAEREKRGLVKVITDKKGYILGAHAVGKGAGEWMQQIVYAKQHGHKIGNLSNVVHPYPTRTLAVQKTADQYWRNKLFEGRLKNIMKRYIQFFR